MADPETVEPAATPILYLDVDDEITSTAARIRAVGAERVALVVPFGSRLATSRINFRLLAREAAQRGKVIEIVAADASARALASSAGLPVHPSVAAFEDRGSVPSPTNGATPDAPGATNADDDTATRVLAVPPAATAHPALAKPRDRAKVPLVGPARPAVRTSLALGAAVALVALLAVGAWAAIFVLPSAMISIAPRAEPAGPFSLTVEARADVETPDPDALVIPARRFDFDLVASEVFPATGVKVTETKATGTAQFSNFDAFRTRRIDARSIVATEAGIQFVVLADVTLPPAGIDFGDPFNPRIIPSTSSAGIEAVLPGPDGNVNNNTITVLPEGANEDALDVTNPEATSGGTRSESPQASQADVDAALATLAERLREELDAIAEAPTGVPDGTLLFAQTALVGEATPTVDPAGIVGTEGAEFELGLTAPGSLLGVDPAPLELVAGRRLAQRIPEGWRVAEGSIEVAVGEPFVLGDIVTFPVTMQATRIRVVDRDAVLAEARGLILAEALARLERYGDVEITLWPDWVTDVPADPSKVTVTILEARPAADAAPAASP